MEGHFPITREELFRVQMDVKQVQAVQNGHIDRILRLEKRQADDAALKSVWSSPFPSVLGGTPQHGPIHTPSAEIFDDFDDVHGQNLLGSLQLDAEDEPVRRGASRANSVRFDVSTIQGSSCAQGSRPSSEFGPIRPSSGTGHHPMMERSLSHKSDGRHSSTGHSIHSTHSAISGRTNSLGLDANLVVGGHDEDSPVDIADPPPGLFVLGTVPSIIRCWLNEDFSHRSLLYAVICTGSHYSHIDISLVNELGLFNQLQKNSFGTDFIRLPVYLPEAQVTQSASRTNSPAAHLPMLTTNFNVSGTSQRQNIEARRIIRIFLGSDTLRAHSADVLFSRNVMTLYGDDHCRLSVPFVRPEDESVFRNLRAIVTAPELKATASSFAPIEYKANDNSSIDFLCKAPVESIKVQSYSGPTSADKNGVRGLIEPRSHIQVAANAAKASTANSLVTSVEPDWGKAGDISYHGNTKQDSIITQVSNTSPMGDERRVLSGSIWGTWRAGGFSNNDSNKNGEHVSTDCYQLSSRGGRSMKVLKPSKTTQRGRSSSTARTGVSYEPPIQRVCAEIRGKTHFGASDNSAPFRKETRRTVSDEKTTKNSHPVPNTPRSSNPVGGASAFAWMNPGKVATTLTRN